MALTFDLLTIYLSMNGISPGELIFYQLGRETLRLLIPISRLISERVQHKTVIAVDH